MLELHSKDQRDWGHKGTQRWIEDVYGNILPIRRYTGYWDTSASDLFLSSLHLRRFELKPSSFQADDEIVFRVYCTDHTHATLRIRLNEKVAEIKYLAAKKLNLQDKELILVHVKSNGERIIFNDRDCNISTGLSVNGRIFVCPLDHIDAISPLPEQDPFQEAYQGSSSSSVGANSSSVVSQTNNSSATSTSTSTTPATSAAFQDASAQAFGASQQQQAGSQPANLQAANQATNSYLSLASSGTSNKSNVQQSIVSHQLNQTPTNLSDTKMQMSLSVNKLEEFSSRDIAYCLTQLAWSLLQNMHEYELIYSVFGRQDKTASSTNSTSSQNSTTTAAANPNQGCDGANGTNRGLGNDNNNNNNNCSRPTSACSANSSTRPTSANLNIFLRHFNELQYWVVTQICLSNSLSKRAQILRKFIKIAAQ